MQDPDSAEAGRWRPDPYLHVSRNLCFNPHTDRVLKAGDPGYDLLRSLLGDPERRAGAGSELEVLADEGWLIGPDTDPDRLYRLKYISLEAHTVCNQKCYFCPEGGTKDYGQGKV